MVFARLSLEPRPDQHGCSSEFLKVSGPRDISGMWVIRRLLEMKGSRSRTMGAPPEEHRDGLLRLNSGLPSNIIDCGPGVPLPWYFVALLRVSDKTHSCSLGWSAISFIP